MNELEELRVQNSELLETMEAEAELKRLQDRDISKYLTQKSRRTGLEK